MLTIPVQVPKYGCLIEWRDDNDNVVDVTVEKQNNNSKNSDNDNVRLAKIKVTSIDRKKTTLKDGDCIKKDKDNIVVDVNKVIET